MEFHQFTEYLQEIVMHYGLRVIAATVVLIVGFTIISWFGKKFEVIMEKKQTDPSLRHFLKSLIIILFKVLLIISVISMVGIATTSFIAVLGAAGLAIGLALQGSLANFAGGVLILLLKPFKPGHFIEALGIMGTVKEIRIFHSILNTVDNKTIIIPNGNIANAMVTNYSLEEKRRVDMVFGIGYNSDLLKAKEILMEFLKNDERILEEPEPTVTVRELGDSSVDFNVRGWCNASDYWPFYWDMMEKVKLEFDKQDINIPFPQRDVHLYQEKN